MRKSPAVAALVGMMVAGAVLSASPAEASTLVPFAATYQEQVLFVPCPPGTPPTTVCVHVLGLGEATHLGKSTEVDNAASVDFSTTPCGTVRTPLVTLVAANDDAVTAEALGTACSTNVPGQTILNGAYTVTGGTGRFAGARGGGTFHGVSQIDSSCFCRATTTFTFKGTLSSPGSNK